ncbi:MAG: hypothetical protein P8N63_07125 [Pseudomonadales bacterium]|nr:hypothetical protein [Pseudomonadales bacterium]
MTSALNTEQTSEAPRVLIDIENHVAYARLNRAEKMNALDNAMFEAISERFHEEPTELEVWHGRLLRYCRKDSDDQLPGGGLAQAGFNRGQFQPVEVCK